MTLTFILAAIILFALPLIPSIVELITKSDSLPLKVVQDYDTDIRHFARSFKNYVHDNFDEFLNTSENASPKTKNPNNGDFMFIKNGMRPFFEKRDITNGRTSKLIVSQSSLELEEPLLHETEMYSHGAVNTAPNSQFRALFAEGDLDINEDCSVMRWAHANHSLRVKQGCNLYGRASADQDMMIAGNCRIERVNAPKITFGDDGSVFEDQEPLMDLTVLDTLPNIKDRFERRWLLSGNVKIDDRHQFDGDIVAGRNLTIGQDCHIKGSLKSNRDLRVGDGTQIDGSIFSTNDLYIGQDCRVMGPIVAEGTIYIAAGTIIGGLTFQTTVTAPRIEIGNGVIVHGTVWADEGAIVKA